MDFRRLFSTVCCIQVAMLSWSIADDASAQTLTPQQVQQIQQNNTNSGQILQDLQNKTVPQPIYQPDQLPKAPPSSEVENAEPEEQKGKESAPRKVLIKDIELEGMT